MKSIYAFILCTCAFSCVTVAPVSADDDDLANTYPLAVLAFQERGSDVEGLGSQVTDLMFAELSVNPNMFLVDREEMEKILKEQGLSLTGLVNPDEANKIGQLTGARLLVTGSVLQVDKSLYIIAKIIGTETSRVVGAKVKGNVRDDLGNLVEGLAEEVGKEVLKRSDQLVAKPVSRDDLIEALNDKMGKAKRPSVLIDISERHIGQATVDPAAETEVTLFCTELGFDVIDPDEGDKKDADLLITGEGFSEFANRQGDLVWVKARLEVKAVDRDSGRVVAIDRHTTVAVDLTEQVAGKTALQKVAASISERLLPKVVAPDKKRKKKN